jgi:DNA-binding XRE family transcriptional regulator
MADLKFTSVHHDHKEFLERVSMRRGFSEAYEALEVEYTLAHEMLAARARAGLTQEAVAGRMGTTKSAISRLESAGKHAPSVASLKKYAAAVGCTLKIELVPTSTKQRKGSKPTPWFVATHKSHLPESADG